VEFVTLIAESPYNDPWYNIALEEAMLHQLQQGQVVLYLWQNQHTVVIGRNQNAWKECRCQLLEEEGGKLARRMSGGGAVYHDLGNLNFTFLLGRHQYDLAKQLQVILNALAGVGIQAEFSGRNDLTVLGRKFSGNAYYYHRDSALHHGTILVNADFAQAGRYLQPSKQKMQSKGVESVGSRVINLADLVPGLSIAQVKEQLIKSFVSLYGGNGTELDLAPLLEEADALHEHYSSWEWRYGKTPAFALSYETRFSWGELTVGLGVKNGHIVDAVVYSDALQYTLTDHVRSALLQTPFESSAIAQALEGISAGDAAPYVKDVKHWLVTQVKSA
jgi:lipoate-protein ligase A